MQHSEEDIDSQGFKNSN